MTADEYGTEVDEPAMPMCTAWTCSAITTHVCLFYGANPEAREDFVTEFELPEDRAAGCAEEYALAATSWGVFLDQIAEGAPGTSLSMEVDTGDSMSILLGDEVGRAERDLRAARTRQGRAGGLWRGERLLRPLDQDDHHVHRNVDYLGCSGSGRAVITLQNRVITKAKNLPR